MQSVIFLNGRLPATKIIKKFIDRNTLIIAADGGANQVKDLKMKADFIIGDMDSINKNSLQYFTQKKTSFVKVDDQESTDFEKSLKFCIQKKLKSVVIFGATGMRPDHTLNNFSVLKRFYKKINVLLVTDEFYVSFLPKLLSLNYKSGETVSLIPMPFAKGIKTKGLEYALNNEDLEFGVREGALNKSNSDKIHISFKEGDLLIFRKHFL
jgi:thiamine pyrophosphokinase